MAKCEVCENEYDKAFEVVVAGKHHTFDRLRMCNPCARASLSSLSLSGPRPWSGSRRANLLLRSLCAYCRENAVERPRVTRAARMRYRRLTSVTLCLPAVSGGVRRPFRYQMRDLIGPPTAFARTLRLRVCKLIRRFISQPPLARPRDSRQCPCKVARKLLSS